MSRQRLALLALPLVLLLLAFAGRANAQELSSAALKSVNAPPSDIVSGAVALPDPAAHGLRSQAATLTVSLQPEKDGSLRWSSPVAVDASSDLTFLLLAPSGAGWTMTLAGPDGQLLDAAPEATSYGLEGTTFPALAYRFERATPGLWTATVSAPAGSATEGALIVGNKGSATQLHSHLASYETLVGRRLTILSYLYDEKSAGAALVGALQQAELRVRTPDGQSLTVAAGDASFRADGRVALGFTPTVAGEYSVQVVARGALADGTPVLRTAEHLIPVVEPSVALAAQPARTTVAGSRLQIALPVQTLGVAGQQLTASAEVWGSANGAMVPVAWVSGIAAPNNGALTLSLDGRWIALAGAQAPFELRNVRVQELQTSVPISRAGRMALEVGRLPNAARVALAAPTADMMMGARPAAAPGASLAPGGKLMLVHGYCSGGVWPSSQFTEAVVFQDFSKNRTHDQFAQIIRNQGAAYPSFGVVAHSQGGAASLHLYTYYWSGLDYATGTRLIQSVGTPYQGTALAGNLAVLGQIFGVGCGTNSNLTYDGAALWLSGIPSWARSRVYFATTSFTDVWWRYDYCQMASDLLLSDPDDGTTERWSGQLSGANNLGHKTGWCHTANMRDPAQYNDSARNANMNAYAAR